MVNGDSAQDPSVYIQETSLTGNQNYNDMASNKIKWLTVDDEAKSSVIAQESLNKV